MENMSTPCAACKYLRRKCTQNCVFAPYFLANNRDKYAAVHKVFGASHVATLINDIHPSHREYAMNSLAFEAQARIHDPVYGCTGIIYNLKRQLKNIEYQIRIAKNELASYNIVPTQEPQPPTTYLQNSYSPNYVTHLTGQQLQQLQGEAQRFASGQTAQMQQTPETQTQHNQRTMAVRDKNIPSKI